MTAREAAEQFRVWAEQNGLINKDRLGNQVVVSPNDLVPVPSVAFSVASATILRHKLVNYIGFNDATQTVVVFTAKLLTKKELAVLPDTIGDRAIEYQVASIGAVGHPPSASGVVPYALHNNFYTCGSSVFVANRVGAGTLGCLVKDADGIVYGLTNNHVTGACNFSEPGLPICAPGPMDVAANGAIDPFTIGHHTKVLKMQDGTPDNVPIVGNTDAALFKIKDSTAVSSMQRDCFDTPPIVGALTSGIAVEKVGRTTGRTTGMIVATVLGAQEVFYSIPELNISKFVYYDVLYIAKSTTPEPFAGPGDSGSLVTSVSAPKTALGLIVAGNQIGIVFVLPLEPILAGFGVTLISGHNV